MRTLTNNRWTIARPQTLLPFGQLSLMISGDILENSVQTPRGLAALFTFKKLSLDGDSLEQIVSGDYSTCLTGLLHTNSQSFLMQGLYNAPRAAITIIDTNNVINRFVDFYSDSLLYNRLFNAKFIYPLRNGSRLVIGDVTVPPPLQTSGTSIVAVCIDQNNVILWKTVFSNGYEIAMPETACQDPLGNIHIGSAAGSRYFVSRLDSNGQLLGHQLVFQHPGNRQIMSTPKIVSDGHNLYMCLYDDTTRLFKANLASGYLYRRLSTPPRKLLLQYGLADGKILAIGNPTGNHKLYVLEPNTGSLVDSLYPLSPQNGQSLTIRLTTPHHDGKHYAIGYPARSGNPVFIRFSGIAPGIAPGVRVPPTVTSQAEVKPVAKLAVYPNPTTGQVRFTGLPAGTQQLHWVDGLGRTVLSQQLDLTTSVGEFETSVNLPKGLYTVRAGGALVKVVVE